MPKEKRPPELMIWDGTSEDIEEWIDRVYKTKERQTAELIISADDIEG